jgi:HD-like signal output (HDOD) protein
MYSTSGPNKTIILIAERQNTASQRLPKTIPTSQFWKTAVKSQDGILTFAHTYGQRHKRRNQVSYVPRKELLLGKVGTVRFLRDFRLAAT